MKNEKGYPTYYAKTGNFLISYIKVTIMSLINLRFSHFTYVFYNIK